MVWSVVAVVVSFCAMKKKLGYIVIAKVNYVEFCK